MQMIDYFLLHSTKKLPSLKSDGGSEFFFPFLSRYFLFAFSPTNEPKQWVTRSKMCFSTRNDVTLAATAIGSAAKTQTPSDSRPVESLLFPLVRLELGWSGGAHSSPSTPLLGSNLLPNTTYLCFFNYRYHKSPPTCSLHLLSYVLRVPPTFPHCFITSKQQETKAGSDPFKNVIYPDAEQ